MIGQLGRQGLAATLRQHCPHVTQRHSSRFRDKKAKFQMRYYLLTRPRTNLVFYWTLDYQPTLIHLYPHPTVGDATRSADGARGGGGVRGGRGDGKSASKQFNVMHTYIKSILQHFFHNTTHNNSGDKLAVGTISTGHVSSTFAL